MKKLLTFFVMVLCCMAFSLPASAKENVVKVFNWSEYVPQDVLDQFEKETGIKVIYTTFESNESMFAKMKLLGGKGYDVVVPSAYFITLLNKNGFLDTIDKKALGDLSVLDSLVLKQKFDPENTISIPYMWGVTGMVVNKKFIDPSKITSWNDFFRPEFKGRIILSDDLRDTMGVALKACGYSINTTKESEIKAATDWLLKLKPSVRIFDVTATKQALISEEAIAGMSWNGDAFIAMQENPDLVFIYPKEGCILWTDSFTIPKHAENKANAHAFIKFMLRPEVAASCIKEYNYTSPNLKARSLLDEEHAKSDILFPTKEKLGPSEFTNDVGETLKVYNTYWEKLKVSKNK